MEALAETTNHVYELRYDERIAVIGAGVAGIATAAALNSAGYVNIVVYDKHDTIGGLWVDNYPNASVQSSPCQYEYPGYPYPEDIRNRSHPPAPTGDEVKAYLYNFCKSQMILDKFQFNTTVSKIAKNHTTGSWSMETNTIHPDTATTTVSTETFAFVVICTGLFSNAPNIIDIPGSNEFIQAGGKIIHSSQWNDMEEFRNQNMIIIGNGKSAADVAVAASKMAKISMASSSSSSSSGASTLSEKVIHPPIQCIRKQTWYVPRCLMQYKFLFHSRFVGLLLPLYYEEATFMMSLIHFICHPIKYVLWRILEIVLIIILRLPYKVWPKLGTLETENALSVPIVVTDERHLYPLRSGEIDLRVTQVEQLSCEKMAHLSDGTTVPVDIVIMGTGWKLDYSFFDKESVTSHLDVQTDGLWLYRNILPPGLPGIAFVGSNTETSINIFTSFIQAHWLVNLIMGNRTPLTKEGMMECIEREKAFKRQYYPSGNMRAACIAAYMQQYHDVLLKEQGIDPYVYTGILGPLSNLLRPILPETMTGRFEMTRSKQLRKKSV